MDYLSRVHSNPHVLRKTQQGVGGVYAVTMNLHYVTASKHGSGPGVCEAGWSSAFVPSRLFLCIVLTLNPQLQLFTVAGGNLH